MNYEQQYIVEKTYGDKSTLIHIDSIKYILENVTEKNPSRRYFKLPALESLEEVSIDVIVKDL